MKVLVLGAGVVGVATAYHLARDGHQVTVVDRQPGAGLETSFANGGQISASHADPWAGPKTPFKALKWLGREDAPLILRPRLDPALLEWLLRFLGNCTGAAAKRNTERMLRLALYSRERLGAIRAETGIEYDALSKGILHVYSDACEFADAAPKAELMTGLGCRRDVLDVAGCLAVEPALKDARHLLVGGIHSPDDESGDAHLYTKRLAEICVDLGVRFRFSVGVNRLISGSGRVMGVVTGGGTLGPDDFDSLVVALGSYTPLLLKPIGIRMPVYPAKGYSVTVPTGKTAAAPHVALIDDERKIVYSRLGDRLRIAGTAELGGYDTTLREARARSVLAAAMKLFPRCGDPARAEFWCGLRPSTPDGVPIIGRTKYENLFVNTGHGTLGWTMNAGSGRVVADLVGGKPPEIDVTGLGLDRYGQA